MRVSGRHPNPYATEITVLLLFPVGEWPSEKRIEHLRLPTKVAILHMSITTVAEQGIEDDQARQLVNDAMNIQGRLGYGRNRCAIGTLHDTASS